VHFLKDPDFLYANVPITIFSFVEVGVTIVAICIATLRPLLEKFNIMMVSSKNNTQASRKSGTDHMNTNASQVATDRGRTLDSTSDLRSHDNQHSGSYELSGIDVEKWERTENGSEEEAWIDKSGGDGASADQRFQ